MKLNPEGGISQLAKLSKKIPRGTSTISQVTPKAANLVRASFTVESLTAYAERTCGGSAEGEPLEQHVRDLLCDLMHLCDLFGKKRYTFDDLLDNARARYGEELEEVC